MKIILCNKFYYRRGGDCIYLLNLEQMLKEHGHEVAIFAMDYPENEPSEWSQYFPSEVKFKPGIGMVEAFSRPFGSCEVRKKFITLLDNFNPDVLHLNNIHSQLSPILGELAHNRGIRVIWTIHDRKLLCPRYDGLKRGKEPCKECFSDVKAVLKNRCMKNSYIASWLAYKEAKKWNRKRLEDMTDVFICPSKFMADRMMEGGFGRQKLYILCNAINIANCEIEKHDERSDYYCYVGRLSLEKGVKTLINVAQQLPYRLVIIGGGPLEDELRQIKNDHITLTGQLDWRQIKEIEGKAKFNVLPSEVCENNPLSVLEAKCLGTPVLGARIGGIPELIEENISGMTFESGNLEDLKEKIELMWNTSFDYKAIAENSVKRYSSEAYYEKLMKFYKGEE